MGYPTDMLQENETLALDLRPHWWYFSRNILTGIPLFILLVIVLANLEGNWQKYIGLIIAVVTIASAVWLVLKYFQWRMTYFVVTSRRVIYRTGVISKRAWRSRSSGSTTSTSTSASSTVSSAPATSTSSRPVATVRATSTSSVTPTACSTRSTARWRRATCPSA